MISCIDCHTKHEEEEKSLPDYQIFSEIIQEILPMTSSLGIVSNQWKLLSEKSLSALFIRKNKSDWGIRFFLSDGYF